MFISGKSETFMHHIYKWPIQLCPIGADVLRKKIILKDSKDSPQSTKGGL